MNKFTFKKEPRQTGLAGVGNPYPDTAIRHNKKVVGYIIAPSWMVKDNKWGIRLAFDEPNGKWGWRIVKERFDSEPAARAWLNERVEKLVTTGFHYFEED